jgi:hypothetical protein
VVCDEDGAAGRKIFEAVHGSVPRQVRGPKSRRRGLRRGRRGRKEDFRGQRAPRSKLVRAGRQQRRIERTSVRRSLRRPLSAPR